LIELLVSFLSNHNIGVLLDLLEFRILDIEVGVILKSIDLAFVESELSKVDLVDEVLRLEWHVTWVSKLSVDELVAIDH
jgi:hypothetical protein